MNGTSASFSSTVTAVGYSKFWNGTTGLLIGAFSAGAGYGALYSTGVTPSTTNFALATNGASTVINATNDASIVTNNGNGLVVIGTGNVIINNGTTDAGYKLDVNGTGRFSSSVTSDDLILTAGTLFGTGNTGFSNRLSDTTLYLQMPATGFNITDNALNTRFILSSTGAATFSSSVTAGGFYANAGNSARFYRSANDYYWSIHNDGNNYLNFGTYLANGTAYLTNPKMILLDNGNVGIGTSSIPSDHILQVHNPAAYARMALTNTTTGVASGDGLIFQMEGTTAIIKNQEADSLKLGANGSETQLVLTSGGNVLIGTSTDIGALLNLNFTASGNIALNINRSSSAAGYFYNFAIAGSQKQYSYYNGSYVEFAVVGTITATGFYESSDSRLKTLIQDNYQTKGIASITPKLYTKNGKVELGYYAQDFVGVLDSAISKGSDDMLSLSYREVLVAKVYALEQRIKELETK